MREIKTERERERERDDKRKEGSERKREKWKKFNERVKNKSIRVLNTFEPLFPLLVAKLLYNSQCPSVRPSVCPSVRD